MFHLTMVEIQSQKNTEVAIRPVLLADAETVSNCAVFLRHLFTGFADADIEGALICPPGTNIDFLGSDSVEIISHPAFKFPLLWRQNRDAIQSKLAKFKPTVLHCLGQQKAPLTEKLAGHFDIPSILSIFSMRLKLSPWRRSMGRFAAVLAPSDNIADKIKQVHAQNNQHFLQINMGTVVEDSCACFSQPQRLASMVMVHPLDNLSKLEPVLCAARHLAIDGYEFMLVVVGSGRAEKAIRRIVKDMGLSNVINIIDTVEPLRSVLAGADIFIRPQPCEAFDSSLIEAMSVGMAVAACSGGADDDLLIDGQTALLFDPEDELSIYAGLQQLLDKHDLAKNLARAAQSTLREDHSVAEMVDRHIDLYRNCRQTHKQKQNNTLAPKV